MNDSHTAAYIETEVLKNWSLQMARINDEAFNFLDTYMKTVGDLENYMLGNVATGFINDSSTLVEKAKKHHTQMKSVENFLIEVIDTMVNQ